MWVQICVPAAPSLTQLPANVLGEAAEGSPGDPDQAPGSALAVAATWIVNQQMEDICL